MYKTAMDTVLRITNLKFVIPKLSLENISGLFTFSNFDPILVTLLLTATGLDVASCNYAREQL